MVVRQLAVSGERTVTQTSQSFIATSSHVMPAHDAQRR
jgi:hypothetical protein